MTTATKPAKGLYIMRRKDTSDGVRIWWRCDNCGSNGNGDGAATLVLGTFELLAARHRCDAT